MKPPEPSFAGFRANSLELLYHTRGDFMQVARTSTQSGWKQVYQEALLELDPNDLLAKLKVAETAIDERLDKVLSSGATDRRELTELQEAKRAVVFLGRQEQEIQTTVK
jgi:hypothetical protein